jgi:hypothetical protein
VNVLELRRDRHPASAVDILRILVDGRDLLNRVRTAEAAHAAADGQPALAGSYSGPDLPRIRDLRAHLHGRHDPMYDAGGATELLLYAECLEPGCWPLVVAITAEAETVRWAGYRQPHRPHWTYEGLPRFVFDLTQYDAAIARVAGL